MFDPANPDHVYKISTVPEQPGHYHQGLQPAKGKTITMKTLTIP